MVGCIADGGGGAEATTVVAVGADWRRHDRRRAVHVDQRGDSVRAALSCDRRDGSSGYRCTAISGGESWCWIGGCWDGGQHLRDVCGQFSFGGESSVRGGSRPAVSVGAGADSSALQDAVGEPAAAGGAEFPAAAGDWKIPGAVLAGNLLGVAVLR